MSKAQSLRTIIGVSAALYLAATTSAAPPAKPDTITQARKAFDSGEYRQALGEISKGLSLAAPEPTPDEKYQLLMLRGESLLRIGERAYARDAFEAATNASTDLHRAAAAKATAVLISLSRGPEYRPGGGAGEPIPIVPQDSRARATRAAFQDLRDRHMTAIQTALEGDTLPPLLDLIPTLGDMFALELASQGQATRTSQVLRSFGEHARLLMGGELRRIRCRVASFHELASSLAEVDRAWGSRLSRRGLRTDERADLQELIEYTASIRSAALHGRRIARSFGFEGRDWDPVLADVTDILELAATTWERRF